jgi:hypothetical protein
LYEYNQELYNAWKHGKNGGSIFGAPVNGAFTAMAFSDGAKEYAASSVPAPSANYSSPSASVSTYTPFSRGYSGGSYSGGGHSSSVDGSSVERGIGGIFGVIVVIVILGAIFGGGDKKANTSTASASSTTSVSTPFAQGAADRQAWENWFNGLSDDYRAGADHWATVRNDRHPSSCFSGPGQTSDAYRWGCLNARQFFNSRRVDTRRKTEAEYFRGWNSI